MTETMADYRRLERRLWILRWRNEGRESAEEDAILDEMDRVWGALTEGERTLLNQEGPRCWPMDARGWVPTLAEVAQAVTPEQPCYEGFACVAETIQGR